MSRTLITNARLLCPAAGLDEPGSLLIENGEIATIGDVSGAAETTIDAQGPSRQDGGARRRAT